MSGSATASRTPTSAPTKRRLGEDEKAEEEKDGKRQDMTESPRKAAEKRSSEAADEAEEQRGRRDQEPSPPGEQDALMHEPAGPPRMSPTHSLGHLYPPHYAGVEAGGAYEREPHGDEDMDPELMPDEVLEEQYMDSYGGDEGDDPPQVSAEELERLDMAARETGIKRMIEMPAMIETDQSEVQQTEGYIISTEVVLCWKHRVEQGGWFRRARLVARQFRNSIELDATFAPTSIMAIPKLLIHYMLNLRREFVVVTLDIKDAFLMAQQPLTENAYVQVDDRIFKLRRCLPGQRTAASQWFQLFASTCREHGLEQDPMLPSGTSSTSQCTLMMCSLLEERIR